MTALTGVSPATHETSSQRRHPPTRIAQLVWMLAWRDIRVRYKHSLLGASWAVLPPVAMMLIFNFVFGTVTDIDRQKLTGHATMPYALFAFSGLVPWTFFANGLSAAITSLASNRQLVTKIYFPRQVFPLASLLGSFIDFLLAMLVLGAMAAWYHFQSEGWRFEPSWALLCLPVVVAVQLILMAGLSLLLAMANLFYRDVGFLFRSVIQLWMFVTCVVYHLEATTGWKRLVIQLNPMTPIIRAYRDCLLMGRFPFDAAFGLAAGMAALCLFISCVCFRRCEYDFAEVI